jgi:diacylglycerol kinase family enzyme
LAGRDVVATVLPLGTANNVARTLGIDAKDPLDLIARWASAPRRDYDVPVVAAEGHRVRFVECVGGGLFADHIEAADRAEDKGAHDGGIEDASRVLRDIVERARPARWEIVLDERDLSGDYLGVEVMNIRTIGPNISIAPAADPGDGLVEVVRIRPSDRDALLQRVPSSEVTRGRVARLRPPAGCRVHVDDQLQELAGSLVVSVDGTRVPVLVPSR